MVHMERKPRDIRKRLMDAASNDTLQMIKDIDDQIKYLTGKRALLCAKAQAYMMGFDTRGKEQCGKDVHTPDGVTIGRCTKTGKHSVCKVIL